MSYWGRWTVALLVVASGAYAATSPSLIGVPGTTTDAPCVTGEYQLAVKDTVWRKCTNGVWNDLDTGGGGSENTSAVNLGGGLANFSTEVGDELRFNSFSGTDFDLASNLFTIDAAITRDAEAAAAYEPLGVAFSELSGTASDAQVNGASESDEVTGLTDGQISDTLTASTSTTAAANDNDTSIATTAFVQQEIDDGDLLTDNCALENDATPIPDSCVGDGSDAGGGSGPQLARQSADHTLASATATEIPSLQVSLGAAGTYLAEYWLFAQTSLAGTGINLGINYTGTVTKMMCQRMDSGSGVTAATGVLDGTITALTGNVVESHATLSETTTAPNMGPNTSFATANENVMMQMRCVLVVSNTGDLEIWHASENANNTTIQADSIVRVTNFP